MNMVVEQGAPIAQVSVLCQTIERKSSNCRVNLVTLQRAFFSFDVHSVAMDIARFIWFLKTNFYIFKFQEIKQLLLFNNIPLLPGNIVTTALLWTLLQCQLLSIDMICGV